MVQPCPLPVLWLCLISVTSVLPASILSGIGADITSDYFKPQPTPDQAKLAWETAAAAQNALLEKAAAAQKSDPWEGYGSEDEAEEADEKRAFSPWSGKRAFSPWSGKRAFSPWSGKRAFSPWSGKRASEKRDDESWSENNAGMIADDAEEKRAFSPWSGKRGFSPWSGKRAFSPWSGKRAFSPWSGKRAFNPWSGKRSGTETEVDKREFSPWSGKRASFSPWSGKRSADEVSEAESEVKRAFSPWSGKRSME